MRIIYEHADVLHCEPIEKVADDAIGEFGLTAGDYDNVGEARYAVPDVWTMGKVYARLIEDVSGQEDVVETLLAVYTSWIDERLSDYNAAFYYQPRDYLAECCRQKERAGRLIQICQNEAPQCSCIVGLPAISGNPEFAKMPRSR